MIPIKPKNVFWSDEQWRAIFDSGKSILVNAGAGSGKTAVLTQRIIEILKNNIGLDRLVVLTFTKAAASEMKERVRKQLMKIVATNPKLSKQLDYIDQAAIQTFDAFALSLVKRYHYLLGVNKNINIGDKVILALKRKEIITAVFNELYESKNQDFLDLISTFSVKKDDLVREYIYNICIKIDLLANSEEFLENYLAHFYSEEFLDARINEFDELIKFDIERIRLRLQNIENIVSDDKLVSFYEDLKSSLTDILAARTYKGYLDCINTSLPRMPAKIEDEDEKIKVKYERDQITKLINKIKDNLVYSSSDEIKEELISTKRFSKVIIEIVREVNIRYLKAKEALNLYDFLDIAKMAVRLFRENNDLRNYYKSNLYEILVDEYQDTSDIQEELISLISNNNVYMVGDMKQSIYRFRNANPDIFKNKYDNFKDNPAAAAIDLSKNFRSRREVLNNINKVFQETMSPTLGGVDYNDNHALEFGNKKYDENIANENYDFEIFTYSYAEDGLTTSEKEAFIVANDIKNKIEAKYQIYDKDLNIVRDARFSDFTILVSEKSKFELYKKIFEYKNLPLVIHKEEDFVRSNEIYVIKNILRAIYSLLDFEYYKDNFKDAIYSVLRSFLIEATDKDISLIFIGDIKEGLNLRFKTFYSKLTNIARKVEKCTLSDILDLIYQEFDIYVKIVKLGNVNEIENKLNFLLDKFKELDSSGYNLLAAINYLEVLINEGYDIETSEVGKIDDSAINIMTIHKSKGLEFPVCYYVELSSRFKTTESNDRIVFDKVYGLVFPVFKEGLRDTIYKSLLKNKYLVEEISERLRLFYVALTRAKEKMILVSPEFDDVTDFSEEIPLVERLNYNSFYSILNSLKTTLALYIKSTLVNGSLEYKDLKKGILEVKKTTPIEIRSVNVKKELEEKEIASSASKKLLDKETIKLMEFGTLIHSYLELIDYKLDLDSQLNKLNLDENQKAKIRSFYDIDIFKKNIINIYHEYQFSYSLDNILYKGIIDLIVELEDELIIIDFKLSNLEKKEYKLQLEAYYNYLKNTTNKKVKAYLYSVINEELRLIIEGE